MNQERLASQDIAKGMMIFFAVLMHTVGVTEPPSWRVAISTFHVPLFFLVSGIVVGRAKNGWPAYIRKNALAILVPYFVWALIFTPFRLDLLPWIFYGNWVALNRIGTNTALWFLPALFCARLMFEAVMRFVERMPLPRLLSVVLAAVVAFVVGMTLPQPDIGYPLGLNCAIIALGFFLLGSVIADFFRAAERQNVLLLLLLALVTTALFVYGAFIRPGEHYHVGIAEFRFGSRFWFFWNALLGCASVLAYASILAVLSDRGKLTGPIRRFSIWLGRNTIGVLILHMPVIRLLVLPAVRACGFDCHSLCVALAAAVVTVAVSCPLICAVQALAPKIVGLFGLKGDAEALG